MQKNELKIDLSSWRKNWDKESVYPSAKEKKITGNRWAWEFLRRNKDFQKEFVECLGCEYRINDLLNESIKSDLQKYFRFYVSLNNGEFTSDIPEDIQILKNESYPDYMRRLSVDRYTVNAISKQYEFCDKWGLSGDYSTFNPGDNTPPQFEMGELVEYFVSGSSLSRPADSCKPKYLDEITLKFSLHSPQEELLDEIEKIIKERLEYFKVSKKVTIIHKRPRISKLSTYLRLLDAKYCGASPAEMAETFFPGKLSIDTYGAIEGERGRTGASDNAIRSVRHNLDKAEEFRDGGFRFLLKE